MASRPAPSPATATGPDGLTILAGRRSFGSSAQSTGSRLPTIPAVCPLRCLFRTTMSLVPVTLGGFQVHQHRIVVIRRRQAEQMIPTVSPARFAASWPVDPHGRPPVEPIPGDRFFGFVIPGLAVELLHHAVENNVADFNPSVLFDDAAHGFPQYMLRAGAGSNGRSISPGENIRWGNRCRRRRACCHSSALRLRDISNARRRAASTAQGVAESDALPSAGQCSQTDFIQAPVLRQGCRSRNPRLRGPRLVHKVLKLVVPLFLTRPAGCPRPPRGSGRCRSASSKW